MPIIWKDKQEVRAAFINRESERKGYEAKRVTDLPGKSEEHSALIHNRDVVSRYFNEPGLQLSMGKQVHMTRVQHTRRSEILEQTDGLVTEEPGLAVAVMVADCAALLLADRVNRVVAAVHAGWRGAADGIISIAIDKMTKAGAEADLMECYISPCISLAAFEVGEEVACRFPQTYVDRSKAKPHVDLGRFIRHELVKNGLSEPSIYHDERCTYAQPSVLHSHRRDGLKSGRMMAVIALTNAGVSGVSG